MEMTQNQRDVLVAVSELLALAEFLAKSGRPEAKPIVEVIILRVHEYSKGKKSEIMHPQQITATIDQLLKQLGLGPTNIITPNGRPS